MTKEEITKELDGLCGQRDKLLRDVGITEGAIQVWQYLLKGIEKLETADAPAVAVEVGETPPADPEFQAFKGTALRKRAK